VVLAFSLVSGPLSGCRSDLNKPSSSILRIAARGLQLVEEKLNSDCMFIANRVKAPLRSRHRGSETLSGCNCTFDTFADEIIDEGAEKSFQAVMAILDEATAIKNSQANHIRK
jgi:hypothetical protein